MVLLQAATSTGIDCLHVGGWRANRTHWSSSYLLEISTLWVIRILLVLLLLLFSSFILEECHRRRLISIVGGANLIE